MGHFVAQLQWCGGVVHRWMIIPKPQEVKYVEMEGVTPPMDGPVVIRSACRSSGTSPAACLKVNEGMTKLLFQMRRSDF